MRVSENRGPEYITLSSRILNYKNPKIRYPFFRKLPKCHSTASCSRERAAMEPRTMQVLDALENSVSQYPRLEGRFAQATRSKGAGLIPSRGLACFFSLSQFLSWSSRVFQVSGVSFQFDAAKPPNQRIVEGSVRTEPQYGIVQGMPASFTFPLLCLRS